MDAYPDEYIAHELPLVLLSGLAQGHNDDVASAKLPRQDSGTRIQTNSPGCSSEQAQQLFQQFLQLDGTGQPWNSLALPGPSGMVKYKMQSIGRVGVVELG